MGQEPPTALDNQSTESSIEPLAASARADGSRCTQREPSGGTSITRTIEASSEAQAKIHCRQLKEDIKLLSTVNHPQIGQIRECRTEGTSILISQDTVAGHSCSDEIASQGRFTEQDTIELIKQVLSLLLPIHKKGLAHRNLSPDTIYLRSADGLPVLTQFQFLQDVLIALGAPCKSSLRDSAFQLTGIAVPRGVCEDLYCLALTAIVLMTGRPLGALFDRQMQGWSWKEYQHVSYDFGRTIDQMLSSNPNDWFRSAEEFLFAIDLATFISSPAPATEIVGKTELASSDDFLSTLTPQTPIGIRRSRPLYIQCIQWFALLGLSAGLAFLMLRAIDRVEYRRSTNTFWDCSFQLS